MAGHPITEIRGYLPHAERFVRKHLRKCSSQLRAGQYRDRANLTDPKGNGGDRHLAPHMHTCVHREPKWEVEILEEEIQAMQGNEEQREE